MAVSGESYSQHAFEVDLDSSRQQSANALGQVEEWLADCARGTVLRLTFMTVLQLLLPPPRSTGLRNVDVSSTLALTIKDTAKKPAKTISPDPMNTQDRQ